ncbi:hypothetical protein D8674_033186 [Pyrus ussuriensis x Pyrus communis]|uniref:Uncharacterized protein n=1 Tax=Pyrus ussuriensis x Pyrus communis TaxID=2448454 RepID=A0A5N5HQ89_9ROSA|nr:hypothetical protein D8674_033186 [Pyrus ussuriensis x Pyrus communis]
MEGQQSWRPRLSFRSATIMMCLLNLITALPLRQGFLSSATSRSKLSASRLNSAALRQGAIDGNSLLWMCLVVVLGTRAQWLYSLPVLNGDGGAFPSVSSRCQQTSSSSPWPP